MPTFLSPDIYAREVDFSHYVKAISTSACGIVGIAERGPINKATLVTSWEQFLNKFGSYTNEGYLAYAARSFFDNGGSALYVNRIAHLSDPTDRDSIAATRSAVLLPDRTGSFATLQTGTEGIDRIHWQAVAQGATGNGISVEIKGSGSDSPLSVDVVDQVIMINLATDNSGNPISTVDQIVAAISEHAQASTLVQAATQDSGVVQPVSASSLTGGQDASASLRITAANEGVWGNKLSVQIEEGTLDPLNTFNLVVYLGDNAIEVHKDLSVDESTTNHVEFVVNDSSEFIRVYDLNVSSNLTINRPANQVLSLVGGDDGLVGLTDADFAGDPSQRTEIFAFDEIESLSLLVIPGITSPNVIHTGISYAESRKDLLFLCEAPIHSEPQEAVDFRKGQGDYSHTAFNSSYAAMYYPWLEISDPLSGSAKKIPPSGAIAGCIARSDYKTNVWNAPAGIDRGRVHNVLSLGYKTSRAERDVLYPEGINVIASFPGTGINIWGQKTLQAQPSALDRINVRRLMMYLEESISASSRFVVFEPNNELTWRALLRVINPFLQDIKDKGAMKDVLDLLSGDRLFVLVKLRQISLGNEVELELRCANKPCLATKPITVNLEDLEVTQYIEDREFSFTLPESKQNIRFVHLDGHKEKRLASLKQAKLSSAMLIRILDIDGESPSKKKLNEMTYGDRVALRKEMKNVDAGIDTTIEISCDECGANIKSRLEAEPSFLFPEVV